MFARQILRVVSASSSNSRQRKGISIISQNVEHDFWGADKMCQGQELLPPALIMDLKEEFQAQTTVNKRNWRWVIQKVALYESHDKALKHSYRRNTHSACWAGFRSNPQRRKHLEGDVCTKHSHADIHLPPSSSIRLQPVDTKKSWSPRGKQWNIRVFLCKVSWGLTLMFDMLWLCLRSYG